MPPIATRFERTGRNFEEAARTVGRFIVQPEFVRRRVEQASRAGQFTAALLLVALIPVSLDVIIILHDLMVRLFLTNSITDPRPSAPFGVTLVTFIFLIGAVWLWFQWVRTAGFGLVNLSFGGDS